MNENTWYRAYSDVTAIIKLGSRSSISLGGGTIWGVIRGNI